MRIDLLLVNQKCYSYETYAVNSVIDQLKRFNIAYKCIYLNEACWQDYLFYVQTDPPHWTLSFEDVFPYVSILYNLLYIPHFFWLEGSFAHGVHFLNSDYGTLGIGDVTICKKLNAHNVFYLPQGVCSVQSIIKTFDVVLLGDLIALPFLEKTWKELFTVIEIQQIKHAIDQQDPLISLSYYFYVEQYLNSQKNQKQVLSFKEVALHVFGEHAGTHWLVQLPPLIHLHSSLPYTEYFELLKISKMILLSQNHPWYFSAVASNCLPIESEQEAKFYLKYPSKREEKLMQLQETMDLPSWNTQVNSMINFMNIAE